MYKQVLASLLLYTQTDSDMSSASGNLSLAMLKKI